VTPEQFKQIQTKFNQLKGKQELLQTQLADTIQNIEVGEIRLKNSKEAREIIQIVAQKTLQNLEFHISKLVTMALMAVFPNPPEFIARIEVRRNQTECDLLLKDHDVEIQPIEGFGGGVLDVVSFALRIAYWSLRKNRHTLILDEPFKFVSPDLQYKISDMIKLLAEKLNLQIIMVSHAEDINVAANKTFLCTKIEGVTKIEEI